MTPPSAYHGGQQETQNVPLKNRKYGLLGWIGGLAFRYRALQHKRVVREHNKKSRVSIKLFGVSIKEYI